MRARRTTWRAGGLGLIACGVLGLLTYGVMASPTAQIVGLIADVVYAGAVCFLAVGLSRDASVVGRRPLGVFALVLVALSPLANRLIGLSIASWGPEASETVGAISYASLGVVATAGIIAAVQIGRVGTIPRPWRWAPLVVFALHAVAWALPQVIGIAGAGADLVAFSELLAMFGLVVSLSGTLGLGVVALLAAGQERPESVEVFRSR